MKEAQGPLDLDSLPGEALDFAALARDLRPLHNEKRLELLHFLTRPHSLEEAASRLQIPRQAAQKHIDQLLEVDLIRDQPGQRGGAPVMEYVVVPEHLFMLREEFARLGVSQVSGPAEGLARNHVAVRPRKGQLEALGPALVCVHGMAAGTSFRLGGTPGPWTIGRDPDRVICLDYDPFVSNRHAEVVLKDGGFHLVDTFSANGTFLNWERLARGAQSPLMPGDVVGLGRSLLVFRR